MKSLLNKQNAKMPNHFSASINLSSKIKEQLKILSNIEPDSEKNQYKFFMYEGNVCYFKNSKDTIICELELDIISKMVIGEIYEITDLK